MNLRSVSLLILAVLTTPALAAPPAAVKQLHQLFDEDWERGLKDYPEFATFLGDTRYNDRGRAQDRGQP